MHFFFSNIPFLRFILKELINQGRQKVVEATNALKALPREALEDIIGQVVSDGRESGADWIPAGNKDGWGASPATVFPL